VIRSKVANVASLSRPGGNLTGVNSIISEVWTKAFDILIKLVPRGEVFLSLSGPNVSMEVHGQSESEALAAADRTGCKLLQFTAATPLEVDEAFLAAKKQGAEGVIVRVNAAFYDWREQLVGLANRYALPTIYPFRDAVEAGGLISYNIDLPNSFRIMGNYTGRILRGEKPSDLPVQQATKFELIVNLKTAKALGLTIPETLLATADEVID
jgi:putative tryptophan/tyrosine transport system substrate-binding protein